MSATHPQHPGSPALPPPTPAAGILTAPRGRRRDHLLVTVVGLILAPAMPALAGLSSESALTGHLLLALLDLVLLAVVAMAAVFWLLRTVPARRAYAVGASFTLAWLVPTTYWYYNFMSLGVAFAASIGWALLMANLFQLVALRKRFGTRLVWPLFALLWLALTWLRLRMPVTEDWWLPHLGYSVWRNSGLVRLGGFGGETVLEAVVLAGGMAVAAAFARRGPRAALAAGAAVIASVIGLNAISQSLPAKPIPPVIALQAMTEGGVDAPATEQDVSDLIDMTREALGGDYARSTTVVWPEHSIPESAQRSCASISSTTRWSSTAEGSTRRPSSWTARRARPFSPTTSSTSPRTRSWECRAPRAASSSSGTSA